jgi:hypothetical protein
MSFKAKLEAAGVESEMLDDLVHDAASRVASRVNNEGMGEQLDYLAQAGFSESEIEESLSVFQ